MVKILVVNYLMDTPPLNRSPSPEAQSQHHAEPAETAAAAEPVVRSKTNQKPRNKRTKAKAISRDSTALPIESSESKEGSLHGRRVSLSDGLGDAYKCIYTLVNELNFHFYSNTSCANWMEIGSSDYLRYIFFDASITITQVIKALEIVRRCDPQLNELLQRQFTVFEKNYIIGNFDLNNARIHRLLDNLINGESGQFTEEINDLNKFFCCWLTDVLKFCNKKNTSASMEEVEPETQFEPDYVTRHSLEASDIHASSKHIPPMAQIPWRVTDRAALNHLVDLDLSLANEKKPQSAIKKRTGKQYKQHSLEEFKRSFSSFENSIKLNIHQNLSHEAQLAMLLFLNDPTTILDIDDPTTILNINDPTTILHIIDKMAQLKPTIPGITDLLNTELPFFGGKCAVISLLRPQLKQLIKDRLIECLQAKIQDNVNLKLTRSISKFYDALCQWLTSVSNFLIVPTELTEAELAFIAECEKETKKTQKPIKKSTKPKAKIKEDVKTDKQTNTKTAPAIADAAGDDDSNQGACVAPADIVKVEEVQQQLIKPYETDLNDDEELYLSGNESDEQLQTHVLAATNAAAQEEIAQAQAIADTEVEEETDSVAQAKEAQAAKLTPAKLEERINKYLTEFSALELKPCIRPLKEIAILLTEQLTDKDLVDCRLILIDATALNSKVDRAIHCLQKITRVQTGHALIQRADNLLNNNCLPSSKARDWLQKEHRVKLMLMNDAEEVEVYVHYFKMWLQHIQQFVADLECAVNDTFERRNIESTNLLLIDLPD